MGKISRRAAMTVGAVIPFSQWLGSQAWAQGTHIRRDLSTSLGNADLLKYQHGVQLMKARAETDPLNWEFWWYTHAVRNDRSKAGEISRIWGASSPPAKVLAGQCWNTCQAHFNSAMEDYFLPWHRMYVYFFEAVLRNVLYDPSFTLPYWRYTQPSQRALPALFRNPSSALYSATRNGPVNAGAAIDQGLSPSPVNTASLAETSYRSSGADEGFNMGLDFNLHGTIHVLVGNGSQGMGSVPWAARDPIFWMHHCNIDRMWASWNHNGGCNPTDAWLNQTFIFPDGNGNQVVAKVGDFNTIGQRGYAYDTLEPGPHVGSCNQFILNLGQLLHFAVAAHPIIVGPGPVEIPLQVAPESLRHPELLKVPGAAANAAPRPRRLVLHDLSANMDPGVLYAVTVRASPNARPVTVGYVNFFASTAHAGGEMMMEMPGQAERPRFFSFDVSRVLAGSKGPPLVGLRPVGRPNPEAKAVVGAVRLVA